MSTVTVRAQTTQTKNITPSVIWAAGGVSAAIALAVIAILPFAAIKWQPLVTVYTINTTAMTMVEVLTGYFLMTRFRIEREAYLGAFAGIFYFISIVNFIQLITFPGVFTAQGLLNDGPSAGLWVWEIWHIGYAALALLLLLIFPQADGQQQRRSAGTIFMLGAPALALCLGLFATTHTKLAPPLIIAGVFTPLRNFLNVMAIVTNLIACLTYLYSSFRRDNLLSLWLTVCLLANVADGLLSTLSAGRFTAGWYFDRLFDLMAASIMLCVLIAEFNQIYKTMAKTNRSLSTRVWNDGLTGAFNRGYFMEHFPLEILRGKRNKTSLSLIMLDVDHFKKYNDSHGHQMGDECLIEIVGALKAALHRPADFLARYGGEEFAVVLPNTNRNAALQIANSLRLAVQKLAIPHAGTGGIVTISLGFAVSTPEEDSLSADELVRRADLALYQAKHNGRDTTREFALVAA